MCRRKYVKLKVTDIDTPVHFSTVFFVLFPIPLRLVIHLHPAPFLVTHTTWPDFTEYNFHIDACRNEIFIQIVRNSKFRQCICSTLWWPLLIISTFLFGFVFLLYVSFFTKLVKLQHPIDTIFSYTFVIAMTCFICIYYHYYSDRLCTVYCGFFLNMF